MNREKNNLFFASKAYVFDFHLIWQRRTTLVGMQLEVIPHMAAWMTHEAMPVSLLNRGWAFRDHINIWPKVQLLGHPRETSGPQLPWLQAYKSPDSACWKSDFQSPTQPMPLSFPRESNPGHVLHTLHRGADGVPNHPTSWQIALRMEEKGRLERRNQ